MGTFSPTHWLVVIVLLAIFLAPLAMIFSAWRHADEPYGTAGPFGFAGWLVLLVIDQTIDPLTVVGDFGFIARSHSIAVDRPYGQAGFYAVTGLSIAMIVLQLTVIVAMYRKSRFFPRWFFYEFCALAILFLSYFLFCAAFDVGLSRLFISQEISHLIWNGLWLWYILKSKRVRATFVR